MRTRPVVLLALAALLAPPAVLAEGGASTSTSRSFVITGLVLGDEHVDASGKLAIEGDRLIASVGCNTIGGRVRLDGDTVTLTEPLVMTEMACPGPTGDAEATLIKILQRGPFTIDAAAWTGDGAAILVEELPGGPGPGASVPAPDDPVVSSPATGPVEPAVSCPPIPVGTNPATRVDVGPADGSGQGSGGSSGGGSEPAAPPSPAASAIDLPLATAVSPPGAGTGTKDDPGAKDDPGVVGEAGASSDPCAGRMAVDAPAPGAVGAEAAPPKATDDAVQPARGITDASAAVLLVAAVGVLLVGVLLASRRRRSASDHAAGDGGGAGAV
jgi:heat shock protein HslJ